MFFKITLLIVVLLLFYITLDNTIKIENFTNDEKFESKNNAIENFIAYPDSQPFCSSLYSSKARYWSKLPEEYCKGLYVKYNCTVSFYKICKAIICSKNKKGLFQVSKLTKKDIKNLQKYYDKNNGENNNNKKKSLDFDFNEKKLKKIMGKYVLKYKHYNVYYPVQVLKYKKDMNRFDIVMKKLMKKEYKCKK